MKRFRYGNGRPQVKQTVCAVSAAALMLGVSQAATVGFNFQAHYCASDSYSGAVVTGPAFGIGTNSWESLPQMDTGYSCPSPVAYYTLTQSISTTNSGGGLNPLPNGRLNVTWSAYTANVSGFGGYDRSPPNFTFGGNGYNPGNEQVYWGFLRDGVNFGPGSSKGDNNQPGYDIDITGLKSLFTNSSFAVQLIASSDSMQYLTNAFIIDATANTTQSVVYPSTPAVVNVGDTSWVRGIGGGLSTSSGALNTDHIKIIGNRAAHGGDKTNGFNAASTISGFIITDKPVITMPPQQVVVSPGDTVTWSGYACGTPPLSYQWRKDGVPIAGATASAYSITNVLGKNLGMYQLVVSNAYGVAAAAPVTVDTLTAVGGNNFTVDTNPKGPPQDGLVNGATWVATNTDTASKTRTGVMKFNAAHPDQIFISGSTNFDAATGTVMFWVRSAGLANTNNPATLFDRLNGNGLALFQNPDGTIGIKAPPGTAQDLSSSAKISDDKWHQIAVTYDQAANGQLVVYIDGQLDGSSGNAAAWSWQPAQPIELGLSHDTNSYGGFNGLLDDVRVYDRVLTATEITAAFGGALVDTNALTMNLTFDAPSSAGVTLKWQTSDAILQSADNVTGPYKDVPGAVSPHPAAQRSSVKFYRYHGHSPKNVVSNPYLM
ncbi:MAG TPA: LamG-like jellyroll fold domain-containing protein [Verrucomicrobiae bacterium]|nr:LamG-like jellyroll fold domain-containing protein [Verrucomicrobiae bacterium]